MATKWTSYSLVPGGGTFYTLPEARREAQIEANRRDMDVQIHSVKHDGNYVVSGSAKFHGTFKPKKGNPQGAEHMNKYAVTVEVEAPSKAAARALVAPRANPYDKEPVKLYDPQWIKVKGVDVIALPELPDIVAVPTNGRANSARFDIVDLAAGAVLTQLLKSEVRGWLIAKARSAAQDADMPVYAEEETPVEVVEDRQLPLFNGRNPITPYKSASERMMERPGIPPVPYFKLYSAPLRSRLAIRAPMLEASSEDISELKRTGVWKYQPSVITDEMGNIVFDNGVG
jgi:hypothetical protein